MMGRKIGWLFAIPNHPVLASSSQLYGLPASIMTGGYTGPLTTSTTFVTGLNPKKYAIVHINISSASGTFASGQGLTIQLSWFGYNVTVNPTPITSPATIDIVFTPTMVYAIINGQRVDLPFFDNLPNIVFNISGTSPSFAVDAWVEYE